MLKFIVCMTTFYDVLCQNNKMSLSFIGGTIINLATEGAFVRDANFR